jgi:hypothetical protein
MKIKAKDLLKLGFKREDNIPVHELDRQKYHYYTYSIDLTKKDKCLLISCSNDEKENGGYFVEFYDMQGIRFDKLEDLKKLIKVIQKAETKYYRPD